MKTTKTGILILTCFAWILSACEFNKSVNKDLSTGAYSKGDGIGCDDIAIQVNGKTENRNVFAEGESIKLLFNDISGLTEKDGKVFPGLAMVIVKNGKDTVLSNPDLLSDLKEGTDISPLLLQASFIARLPFKNKEQYKVFIKIWDKKGKGTFSYELPFTIQENKLLEITARGLAYSRIYLWDDNLKYALAGKEANSKNTLILILEGLSGMDQVDGKVYPALSVDLTDRKGNKILFNPDILKEYENGGVPSEDFAKGQIPVKITFSSGKINNPCKLSVSLTDRNSDKRIDIRTELEIK